MTPRAPQPLPRHHHAGSASFKDGKVDCKVESGQLDNNNATVGAWGCAPPPPAPPTPTHVKNDAA
jgi:hypothetical protein